MSEWSFSRDIPEDSNQQVDLSWHRQMNNNSLPELGTNSTFCLGSDEKTDITLRYLNNELTVLGFKTIYCVDDGQITLDTRSLITSCYDLVNMYQKGLRIRDAMETKQRRLESDLEHCQKMQRRLKDNLEDCQKSMAQFKENERQIMNKSKLLNQKLKVEREETRRLKLDIQSRDAQFRHEKKKMEREMESLRSHLQTTMTGGPRAPSIEMLNGIQRLEGKRQTWARPKGHVDPRSSQEELQATVVRQMEDKQGELLMENRELRESLLRMGRQLDGLLHGRSLVEEDGDFCAMEEGSDGENSHPDDLESDPITDYLDGDVLHEGVFHMPYDLVRDKIERSLKKKWRRLKVKMSKYEKQKMSVDEVSSVEQPKPPRRLSSSTVDAVNHREEMEHLKRQISQYERTVQKQEDMLKKLLRSESADCARAIRGSTRREPAPDSSSFLFHDTNTMEDQRRLAEEKREFFEQRAQLEAERSHLSQIAIHLSKERQSLESEKLGLLHQQLPSTNWHQSSGEKPRRNSIATAAQLTGSTSSFTPAPLTSQERLNRTEMRRVLDPRDFQFSSASKSGLSDTESGSSLSSHNLPRVIEGEEH